MRDFLGNEIKVGDEAVYIDHFKTSSRLKMGKVIGFTEKRVKFEDRSKEPEKVIDLSAFLNCIIVKEAER